MAILRPYHANLGKRLVKRPKAYFLDTGTLAYLLSIDQPGQVLQGMAAGPILETAVFGQLQRLFLHHGEPPRIHFWRTADGHEVDFVVDDRTRLRVIQLFSDRPHRRRARHAGRGRLRPAVS